MGRFACVQIRMCPVLFSQQTTHGCVLRGRQHSSPISRENKM